MVRWVIARCIALAPDKAWCHYNRGLAYDAQGQADRALVDYNRALRLDPALSAAAVNRAILHYRANRFQEALNDLQTALAAGADAAVVHYNRALVHLAQGDQAAARASAQESLRHDPAHKGAISLTESLRAEE